MEKSSLDLSQIFEPIRADLEQVDREFGRHVQSQVDLIPTIGKYIQTSGGKRMRPAVLLMAARLSGYTGDRAVLYAAVVEFIHTATLVHDDIIDDSDLRRGRLAVHSRWGNDITVLLGDYLYIKSMALALTHDTLDIVRLLCDVTLRMIEGELFQLTKNGDADITEDEHFDIIRRKTAYLFGGCAQIGGMLGKVGAEREQALREYGFNLGIAFQLVDDLLDVTGDAEALGKPVGGDLREGKMTLPLIHLLQQNEAVGAPDRARHHQQQDRRARAVGRAAARAQAAPLDRLRRTSARPSSPSAPRSRSTRFRRAPSATRCWRCPTTSSPAIGDRAARSEPATRRSRGTPAPSSRSSPDSRPACRDVPMPTKPPRNASTSFVTPSGTTKSATTSTTTPRSPTRSSIACCTSSSSSKPSIPDLVTADSPTQRVAGRPVEGFETVEHLVPMLSLDNAYNEDELRAFDERVRKAAGLGDRAGRLRRRAEDRRPEHRADLRGRPSGPRRHARRRRPRRGRDDERADDSGDSAALRGGPDGPDRGPRRSLSAARVVRSHEPRARGARRAAVREPAERRRRHDAESRSGARREAGLVGVHLSGRGRPATAWRPLPRTHRTRPC